MYEYLSPQERARSDYQEGDFHNPYPEGSNDWQDYEAEKSRLLNELERRELCGIG